MRISDWSSDVCSSDLHDVNQIKLARSLDAVVEDCVNAVGVDVNTASAALLARVSGLNSLLAKNIVSWRDENGAFPTRDLLRKVPRFGEKRSEERRVGKECVSTCKSRWSPYP